ncbi:MAG: hypothetical protein ACJ768_09310 [Gaiellaceae bacterium]
MPELPRPSNSESPTTFDELLNGAGGASDAGCLKCGSPATNTVNISVGRIGEKPTMVARRKARLCEPCAVRIYGPVARALR